MGDSWVDGLIVFLIGSAVGIGELVARYRDEPRRAILTRPAMLYVGINGFASVFALISIRTFGWTADASNSDQAERLLNLLLAGFGAMAVFRTSLFVVRVGTSDVGVGPVAFLQILLGATDRGVDRKRASERAEKVVRIMGDLDPGLAYHALPAFAIMLMQNLTLEDQKAIGDQVKALSQPGSDVTEQAKVLNVGLLLMNFVGEEVLEDAVRGIRGRLKPSGVRLPTIARSRSGAEIESDTHRNGDATDAEGAISPEVPSEPTAKKIVPMTDLSTTGGSVGGLPSGIQVDKDSKPAKGKDGSTEPEPPPGQTAQGTALPPQ